MSAIAVSPVYETPEPDSDVALYAGDIRVSWSGVAFTGAGKVDFVWRPSPHVEVDVTVQVPFSHLDAPHQVEVELLASGGNGSLLVSRIETTIGGGAKQTVRLRGSVLGELLIGSPAATDEVVFHVPNFPDFLGVSIQATSTGGPFWRGRMVASTPDWRIELDSVPYKVDLFEALTRRGGYGITHVGRLTRIDAAAVPYDEARRWCEDLAWWLSLLRCERTEAVLVVGLHAGAPVWQVWRSPTVAPWTGRWTWLPRMIVDASSIVLPVSSGNTLASLRKNFEDPAGRRVLALAIDWLTQSISNGHTATRVVLAQSGLELMAWSLLVRTGRLSEVGFDRLTAADAIRLALSFSGIELEVPVAALELHAAASASGGSPAIDGPASTAEIRNGIIHPKSTMRFSDDQAVLQGGHLAARYLELLLLRELSYDGPIYNRLTWDLEAVPWMDGT